MNDGIHHLSLEQYEQLDRLNWSRLRLLARSPLHFKAYVQPDTVSLRRGRVAHVATLEPERYRKEVVVYEGKRDDRIKAWQEFQLEHAGKLILNPREDAEARAIADAVRSDPVARKYLEAPGRAEVTACWTFAGGIKAKGRVDWLPEAGPIVSLKTTKDASPDAFGRVCAGYGYCAAEAWYRAGVGAAEGAPLRPVVVIAVEAAPPHAVAVYRVPESPLTVGEEECWSLMNLLLVCQEKDSWPSYGNGGEMELTLPKWSFAEETEAT